MQREKLFSFIEKVLKKMPEKWIGLTTHRLDIYNEDLAKVEFLEAFENLYKSDTYSKEVFKKLPTAYDYIRLGHPLSCILEWSIAKLNSLKPQQIIAFDSRTMPLLAVLRKNKLLGIKTQISHFNELPTSLHLEKLSQVYGYNFEIHRVNNINEIKAFDGENIVVTQNSLSDLKNHQNIDFHINMLGEMGSIIIINSAHIEDDVAAVQYVRRRETVAMTPKNCFNALASLVGEAERDNYNTRENLEKVYREIKKITYTSNNPILGSSGLSVQYAIMMGLIDHAKEKFPNKVIKIIVPPNCYGGTNDQARRVVESTENVDILDLPVDSGNDMVNSTALVLNKCAELDAVPLVIAEIPTNPRVEVPDLEELKNVLTKKRKTPDGNNAVEPIFILDQTFCPNYNFLGEGKILSEIETIAYVSGSKFPSGGKCTAGYLVANEKASHLLKKIETHIKLCDNEATPNQLHFLALQMSSMLERIDKAYKNTREFVDFIEEKLPQAKINFVTKELAERGFTPSVFSLDLPTKGNTAEERETHKRYLNQKLIDMMITQIPEESKYCVSYGQLKGCYWTIPATSTQGTTKEEDKDYIARVSVSTDLDLEKHKQVFAEFVDKLIG